ncbi:MAG TPA: PARP-type zinc finger-containing protein, partial [Polyangiaceae bacterium]
MPSVIERASSGRAKCRVCGQAIAKGEERLGEALPNAYGEGESLFWFHLGCAACCRPESFLGVLEQQADAGSAGSAMPAMSAELVALAQGGLA